MKTLTRYLISNLLSLFILFEASFIFLYLIIDLIAKMDNFLLEKLPVELILSYTVAKIPTASVQVAPVATLLASSVLLLSMVKKNELIALRSVGISSLHIKVPIIVFGLIMAWLSLIVGEFIAPSSLMKAQRIWGEHVKRKDAKKGIVRDRVWLKKEGIVFYCDRFIEDMSTVEKPLIIFVNSNFQVYKQIFAFRALWQGHIWHLEKGYEQIIETDGEIITKDFQLETLQIPVTLEDLKVSSVDPSSMNLFELKRFADKVSKSGYDATGYLVEVHTKLSMPFIHIIMALIGSSIPLIIRRPNYPKVISVAMLLCFVYLAFYGIFRSIALSNLLQAPIAMWFPNFIFLILGYLLNNLEV